MRADDSSAPVVVIDAPAGRTVHTDLVAEFIAETTAELTGSDPSTGLMLLGGEGAQAVLNRFGARGLLIHSTVREGIPIGTIDGGIATGQLSSRKPAASVTSLMLHTSLQICLASS